MNGQTRDTDRLAVVIRRVRRWINRHVYGVWDPKL